MSIRFATNERFEIICNATGRAVDEHTINSLCAKSGNIDALNIDQFYVGQNGAIILADKSGHMTMLDKKAFTIRSRKYPDLEYFESVMLANIYQDHPDFKNKVRTRNTTVDMFPQMWPTTAGGFEAPNMMAGQAIRITETTVISMTLYIGKNAERYDFYGVFFGNEPAYLVTDPPKEFFDDIKNRKMKSKYKAMEEY